MSSGMESQQFSDGDGNFNRKVFVGGLASKVNEKILRSHFIRYGPIESVTIIRDKGVSKGFGFVLFSTPQSAHWAVSSTNALEGQEVSCKFTVPLSQAKLLIHQDKQRKIFVRELPIAASREDIELYFTAFGIVERCSINKSSEDCDKRTCIVLFDSPTPVEYLLANKDIEHVICGQKVLIFACLSKNEIKEHLIKKEEAFKQKLLKEFFNEIENEEGDTDKPTSGAIAVTGELDRSKRTVKPTTTAVDLGSTNFKSNNTKPEWNSPFISTGALSQPIEDKCDPGAQVTQGSKDSRFKMNEKQCHLRSYGKLAKTQPQKYLTSRTIPNFSNAWSIGSQGDNLGFAALNICHRCNAQPDFKCSAPPASFTCQSCEQNLSKRAEHMSRQENIRFQTNPILPVFRMRF